MLTETEAIILKQVKMPNGRRMLTMFSKKYGKISVGSTQTEGGKNRTALATRPFTYGKYEIYKNTDNYNLSSGQVIKSYYEFGEDLDKYLAASYVLELTDKVLQEGLHQPKLFVQLIDLMNALNQRSKKYDTLVAAYIVKVLDILGSFPELYKCASCGRKLDNDNHFVVKEGGLICSECASDYYNNPEDCGLIYEVNFGIVDILKFLKEEPFKKLEKLALDDAILGILIVMLKEYLRYHLDIGTLKSEEFIF